jgi:fumarate hydratase class II
LSQTHFESKEKVMTTHRSEKDSMGASRCRPINYGARNPALAGHFRISTEKMPVELIYAGADQARGGEGE